MKNYQRILIAIASSFLLTNCGDSKSAPAEATISTQTTPPPTEEKISEEKIAEEKQIGDEPKPSSFTAVCEEKEEKNPESEDPIIIKTCSYKNYRTISTGTPDFKGRYSYENDLYKLEAGRYKKIANSALFNQKQSDLLKQINQKIKTEYLKLLEDPENKECLEGAEPIRDYEMDELRIGFETDQIFFKVEFGLPSACLAVGGTSVSFKLQEVEHYLNK
ncbi:hypothetical protein [Pedobacter sp. SYSU D00535]|uniref:hypothetical protein n=1 Tax=Pedobacter sp. SYSU D00535 TaxID=2810308 RepID=UPI001A9641BF|nr:hypothetical protein [Pedobacter sp. SYSU D00535]